jgi:hypothetical protein
VAQVERVLMQRPRIRYLEVGDRETVVVHA